MKSNLKYEWLSFALAILGIITGIFFPSLAQGLSFIGDIFILLLKMLIIPLVFTSIFLSITNIPLQEVKSLGVKTLLYYISTSSLACITGLFVAQFILVPSTDLASYGIEGVSKLDSIGLKHFVTSFFSGNFFQALSEGNIVQIVVFTIILAMASLKLNQKDRQVLIDVSEAIQNLMTIVIKGILKIAPLGVFSLLASIVSKTELSSFNTLGSLFLGITIAVMIHVFINLFSMATFIGKFSFFSFLFKVRKALVVAVTTASSTATLPVSAQVLVKDVGVKDKTSGFVLPLGATLNMDGSALYQSLVILFLGSFAGIELSFYHEVLVFFFVMTSSAGTAGIPGGGMMMVGAVMGMVGIPLEYIGIYLLVDRFWDYPITMVNVLGDLVGAKTIDRYIS